MENLDTDFIKMVANGVGVIEPQPQEETGSNGFISATDLINREVDEIECLVEPILPRSGVVATGGASDTGKSALLRQLGVCVCTGKDFIGFPVNSIHKSAIYVSTEDDEMAISFLMRKQNRDFQLHPDELLDLKFIFNSENLLVNLDEILKETPADLVVIDCFTDIYGRSMNQANEVRTFLNQFSQLSNKHQCLVMFLHHTGKKKENDYPSKHNLLGSQAFEAKMRAVFELRDDLADDSKKHLCIVKGNYLPADFKKESYVLEFTDNLTFRNTGDRCVFDMLVKNDDSKKERNEKIVSMVKAGMTYSQIAEETGIKSRGTISKIVNNYNGFQTFPKETNGNSKETLPF
ncbi:MAG: AAA family ATPase [Bacteroidota bacterium]|nr:AAA family ATPase [Bacteroidota bacterium]